MTFGDTFRGVRVHRLMDGANRKQIRDFMRGKRKRNDGRPKDVESARAEKLTVIR